MNATQKRIRTALAVLTVGLLVQSGFAEATLPEGYTQLDYIESDGNQYIDTGYVLQPDKTVKATLCIPHLQLSKGGFSSAFGCNESGVGVQFNPSTKTSGKFRYTCDGTEAASPQTNMNTYDRDICFICTSSGMTWTNADGTGEDGSLQFATAPAAKNRTIPLYVFANSALNNGAVQAQNKVMMRLYAFQVLSADGNTVELDLIPCRAPNGTVGLYNVGSAVLSDGNFLVNKGSGSFRTSDLDGVRLASVEGTGSQYVNIGYRFKCDDVVTAEMKLTKAKSDGSSSNYACVFGCQTEDEDNDYKSYTYTFDSRAGAEGKFRVNRGTRTANSTQDIYARPLTFTLDWSKGVSWVDSADATKSGSLNLSGDPPQVQAMASAFVFAQSYLNKIKGNLVVNSQGYGTLYSLDIASAGGERVRQYVPFKRSDGKIGLLDLVEGRFYPNGVTTDLVGGEELYAVDGRTAIVDSGAFLPELGEAFDLVRKTGAGTFEAGDAAGYKALSIESGVYSVQDGVAKQQVVSGMLALKGGATLKVDVTADGCDTFAAGTVDLSGASAMNRIAIEVALAEGVTIDETGLTLIESGLSAEDANKFAITGPVPVSKCEVVDGALVLKRAAPEGYTRLDYIESDGRQYIDTGYVLQSDETVGATLCIPHLQLSRGVFSSAFGCNELGTGIQFNPSSTTAGKFRYSFDGNTEVYSPEKNMHIYDHPICVTCTSSGMSWANADGTGEGGSLQFAAAPVTATRTIPLYLFANSAINPTTGARETQNWVMMKLYSFQVLSADGNTVELDLIPCRAPNGVVGLYNVGSAVLPDGNFLVNKGSGSFRTGDLDGVRLAFLEGTGTQYINIGYKFRRDDVVTAKMKLTKTKSDGTSGNYASAFGAQTSGANGTYVFDSRAGADGKFRVNLGSGSGTSVAGTDDIYARPLTFTLDWSKSLTWTDAADASKSGSVNLPASPSQTQASAPAFIFAQSYVNMSKGTIAANSPGYGTLYSFDIASVDGELVRQYVPFKRSDGKVGLLDFVEGRFYPNSVTNKLVTGEELYAVDGHTAIVDSGAFVPEVVEKFDLVRKTGDGTFEAGNAAEYKDLSIESGAYSVQDGVAKRQVVSGTFALKGGATLKIDATADGCDSFAAGTVDLSGASRTNRIVIDVARLGDVPFEDGKFTLIESGLSEGDERKFKVRCEGWHVGVKVNNGALELCPGTGAVLIFR